MVVMDAEDNDERLVRARLGQASIAAVLAVFFGIVSFVAAVLAFASDSYPHVPTEWFVSVDPTEGTARLRFGFWFSALLIISGVAITAYLSARRGIAWVVQTERFRRRLSAALSKERSASATLDQSMSALRRALQGWRADADDNDTWRYRRVEEIYEVEADGTTTSTRTYTIEAVKQVIGFKVTIAADPTATPAEFPSDIDFSARSVDEGTEVEWAVVENGPLVKTFALIFVPPIKAGDTRRFRVKHTWKKFVGDLPAKGASEFFFEFASAEENDVAETDMEFSFSSGLGRLAFDKGDPTQPGELSARHQGLAHERQIWTYKAAALPMNNKRYSFKVRRLGG
ncbi:hypothetical protein [Brevundimonas balnearis]|uniref:ResB-like domain-containing protein n=1 Tax=Brevundimonas balnearis TaxID=1572858 RepID=A0ABV6R2B5_9CAUL